MEYPAYVRPRVKLEFGARSTGEPAQRMLISSDLAGAYPELEFPAAKPRVMGAERTFWEKATLAHVYCRQGKLRGATGFARHWHDLVRSDQVSIAATAIADRGLAMAVAEHKSKFFPAMGTDGGAIDYQAAVTGGLHLVPEGEAYAALDADYREMIAAGYLERAADDFATLMAQCLDLERRINIEA